MRIFLGVEGYTTATFGLYEQANFARALETVLGIVVRIILAGNKDNPESFNDKSPFIRTFCVSGAQKIRLIEGASDFIACTPDCRAVSGKDRPCSGNSFCRAFFLCQKACSCALRHSSDLCSKGSSFELRVWYSGSAHGMILCS